ATQTTPLAPSLKGIAAQKIDYLLESVLFPSKIIKTGFESETITTTDGKVHARSATAGPADEPISPIAPAALRRTSAFLSRGRRSGCRGRSRSTQWWP